MAIWEGVSSTRVVEGWSECCLPRSRVGVGAEGCGKGWSDGRVGSGESWDLGWPLDPELVIPLFSFEGQTHSCSKNEQLERLPGSVQGRQ